MDDLYAGWTLDGAAARLTAGVLRPLAEGRPGAYHRYDWAAGRFSRRADAGAARRRCSSSRGAAAARARLDGWTTLRIWVEAPPALRLARGLARDGAGLEPEWRAWQRTGGRRVRREGTRARADAAGGRRRAVPRRARSSRSTDRGVRRISSP